MDQVKIGKFIAENRKKKNLTQIQLAEKLLITDRAVSKWETGKSMPDSSIMIELCEILDVTVTDLLNGEKSDSDDKSIIEKYNYELQRNNKKIFQIESIIGSISGALFIALLFIGSFVSMPEFLRGILFGIAVAEFILAVIFCVFIEQKVGYYVCKKCGHKHVPSFGAVLFAPHIFRTRLLRCPKCHKTSWQDKDIDNKI